VDTRTGSVASAIWVTRARGHPAIVFVEIDGVALRGDPGALVGDHARLPTDPYQDEGGEG
jgi:hypothetical protein